jgi:ribosomal protein S18 acetylase RimI-like enzyme
MIRERRAEDLERLCAVLESVGQSARFLSGKDAREWLEEYDAELSWVFDMAPVSVTPTKNVVGHVQIYRPDQEPSTRSWAELTHRPTSDLLVIGKLFVRPSTHERGIGRYLLKESVKHVQAQGKVPVLDRHRNGPFAKDFYERLGFEDIVTGTTGASLMIHVGSDPAWPRRG